jgi:peptidyl-prolyl cis-trans isomerase A (cyclophilin A)
MRSIVVITLILACVVSAIVKMNYSKAPEGPEGPEGPEVTGPPDPSLMPPALPLPAVEKTELDLTKAIYNPKHVANKKVCPDNFKVEFMTSKGRILFEVNKDWAPLGAQRFFTLVRLDYFSNVPFFRTVKGFVSQFGLSADPTISKVWNAAALKDDPDNKSNVKGSLTFASGSAGRSCQLFINLVDNGPALDSRSSPNFPPIGKVIEGMDVVGSLYSGYGDGAPSGNGPDQGRVVEEGNAYLIKSFPNLDYIISARILPQPKEEKKGK